MHGAISAFFDAGLLSCNEQYSVYYDLVETCEDASHSYFGE